MCCTFIRNSRVLAMGVESQKTPHFLKLVKDFQLLIPGTFTTFETSNVP